MSDNAGRANLFFNFVANDKDEALSKAIDEGAIANVNIYIFGKDGGLITSSYMTMDYTLSIPICEGDKYFVYAIANAGKELPFLRRDSIECYKYCVDSAGVFREPFALMCGATDAIELYDGERVDITLVRPIAQVVVRGDVSALESGVSVKVNSLAIKNIPSIITLFGDSAATEEEVFPEGYSYTGESVKNFETSGVVFYLFENMQGTLSPNNNDQSKKEFPASDEHSRCCSYIELDATYLSPTHSGTILYRFYLGTDMTTNYDVRRGTTQNITVCFKGDGSIDEDSWRVDVENLTTLVQDIELSPTSLRIDGINVTYALIANIFPDDATIQELTWSSSDASVAIVDSHGVVTSKGTGVCTITASALDGSGVSGSAEVRVVGGLVRFSRDSSLLYGGEVVKIPYDTLSPPSAVPDVISSDTGVATILSVDSEGVTIKALGEGSTTLTASLDSSLSEYNITVEPLRVIFNEDSPLALHEGFDTPVEYNILPERASSLKLCWSYATPEDSLFIAFPKGFESNIVRGIAIDNDTTKGHGVKVSFEEFPEKVFYTSVKVLPALEVEEDTAVLLANPFVADLLDLTLSDIEREHQIKYSTGRGGVVRWEINSASGITLSYDIMVSDAGLISLPKESTAKGDYVVTGSVIADDGNTYSAMVYARVFEEVNVLLKCMYDIVGEDSEGYPTLHHHDEIFLAEPRSGPNNKVFAKVPMDVQLKDEYITGAKGDVSSLSYSEINFANPFVTEPYNGMYRYMLSKIYSE